MLGKYMTYYRLTNHLSRKELASLVSVSPATITQFENGAKAPSFDLLVAIAKALNADISDFLAYKNEHLSLEYGRIRSGAKLSVQQKELIRLAAEEYLNRLYLIVDILGGDVLPAAPACHTIPLSSSAECDVIALKRYLRLSEDGPVGNLSEMLERKGVPVCFLNITVDSFLEMNGSVNGRPFIVINENMASERIRSAIVREMVFLFFAWPDEIKDKERDERAAAISDAFLFPESDAKRELGLHRSAVTKDMQTICKDY